MKAPRNSQGKLSGKVVGAKVKQPAARRAAIKKAASSTRAKARIDFVRSVRG
ncbi:MAG: hypothetical protein WD942_05615 [Dehalococcoidia bacterium]